MFESLPGTLLPICGAQLAESRGGMPEGVYAV